MNTFRFATQIRIANFFPIIVFWTVILFLLVPVGHAQDSENPCSLERTSGVVAGWQLCVRCNKKRQTGLPIVIGLVLTNKSEDIVALPRGLGLDGNGLNITVVDHERKPLLLTERGKELQEERTRPDRIMLTGMGTIGPSETVKKEVNLSEIFSFPAPGRYYITVEVQVTRDSTRIVIREDKSDDTPRIPQLEIDGKRLPKMAFFWEKTKESRDSLVVQNIPIDIVDSKEKETPKSLGSKKKKPGRAPSLETGHEGHNFLVWGLVVVVVALAGAVVFLLTRRKGRGAA